jgi:hypothetical protein
MQKNKLFLLVSLTALLGLVATAALSVGRITPLAQVGADPDMLVPAANVPLNANWKAQPAQGAAVRVPGINTRVNTDSGTAAQNEPFAAVHPQNAKHMVVGANNWASGRGQFEVTAYVTFDGGSTWAASQPYINRNASRLNAADATLAFGADGALYFGFVAFGPADGAVAVSRSTNGGLTWTSQSWVTPFTAGAADKPVLAASASSLYVYYQTSAGLMGRISAAAGANWSNATLIDAAGRYAAPVIDSRGNVNVFYATANSIKLARRANNSLKYAVSTVSNVTPLQGRPTHYRAAIIPSAGVDAAGNLYVAWADGRNTGRGNDILFSRLGATSDLWSAPAVVNSDASSADQLMPNLSVAANGAVTISYLDTRNDAANVNYDIYLRNAADGVHFGNDVRVTSVSSNPNNDPTLQGSLIGDYNATVVSGGVANLFWADTRNNNLDIYFAPVNTNN